MGKSHPERLDNQVGNLVAEINAAAMHVRGFSRIEELTQEHFKQFDEALHKLSEAIRYAAVVAGVATAREQNE